MPAMRTPRPALAALAGAAFLLALLNLHLLRAPLDISPIAPPARAADAPPPAGVATATPLDKQTPERFRETVGRPLFNPGRRPVARKAAAAARPNAHLAGLRLVGVMRAAGRPPRALIRSAHAPDGKWIAEGAEFNGWKLHEVGDRSVVLRSGARSHELKLAPPRRLEKPAPKP